MPISIRESGGGVEMLVKAVPGASRTRIVGPLGEELKIQVAEPPEKGRANAAIESLLAVTLGLSKGSVRVISGHSNPRKRVRIEGVNAEQLRAVLKLE
ncbi:MAG: DUF167 domain-containing protein [Planctomycetes bacterium]|nr:DUF167 domain-containing protein [Planctomycetota bacterium]